MVRCWCLPESTLCYSINNFDTTTIRILAPFPVDANLTLRFSGAQSASVASARPFRCAALMNYSWPGNVRELRNVLQYASVRTTSNVITPADLPPNMNLSEPLKKQYKRIRKLKLTESRVTEALEMASGNKRDAAKMLGVSRSTLYWFFDRNDGN